MSVVLLGGNRFVECQSILGYRGTPVLAVSFDPLRVRLTTPKGVPSGRCVRVDEHGRSPEGHVRVVPTPLSFAVFWDEFALVTATVFDQDTAHLKLDLRPLGIIIFDDVDGLHIGQNVFSGNVVSHAAVGITLGD